MSAATAPTSSIQFFVPALRDGLRAWAGLAGVTITAGPVAPDDIEPRMIRLAGTTNHLQEYNSAFGRTRKESYTFNGRIWWIAVDSAGDAAIDAALTGAFGLYGEIERYLQSDPHVGGTVMVAQATGADYTPVLFDIGTGAELQFTIGVDHELRR